MVPLVEAKKIMAPYGDRSKVVIEPMLTDQWFVDTAKIVGPALEAVRDGTVEILPEQHKKVYFNWLENIEPWCISRQLWWGHQIPVWYGPEQIGDDRFALSFGGGDDHRFCAASEGEMIEEAQAFYGAREIRRRRRSLEGKGLYFDAQALQGIPDDRSQFGKTPTSWTPGSLPASGPSAPSAGPRTRPN